MEIKITGNSETYVEDLENGDLFLFEQEPYLKIENNKNIFLKEFENNCLAVHLNTGMIESFAHKNIVIFPKKSILNVEV